MNVFIWGTGEAASLVKLALSEDVNILGYIDNNCKKQGTYRWNKEVFAPNVLLTSEFDYVVIGAFDRYFEISKQIEEMGIATKKIIQFFNYTKVFPLRFFYNENIITDENIEKLFTNYVKVRMAIF